MKKLSLATALIAATVTLVTANANAYQAEVGGTIAVTDPDHGDTTTGFGVDGTYYFNPVQTKTGPLNEAAFLNRASNVNGAISYADNNDTDITTFGAGVEYYVPNSDFYLSGQVAHTNIDTKFRDNDKTTYGAEVGYLPIPNLLIAAGIKGYDDDNTDDVDPTLRAKYVTKIGAYDVNLEAATSFGDVDYYNIGGDLYLDRTFSVGAAYSGSNADLIDDDVFTIRAKKFFTEQASVEGSVGFGDDYNTFGVRGAYRF